MAVEASAPVREPDWRLPNSFYQEEARQFVRPDSDGLPLDETVALKLLKLEFDEPQTGFAVYRAWYAPGKRQLYPPALTCHGMVEAGQALAGALDNDETVAVYCDYDVDGTTAGEAFRRGLLPYCRRVGYEHEGGVPAGEGPALFYGYADAQQGFGLTNDFVRRAHDAGASVLVTLDCGTGQATQVRFAQQLGMRVIVVDHHDVAENPAEFHLNPKLPRPEGHEGPWPHSENTGAQLAWKLAAAVQAAKDGKTRPEHWQSAMQLAGMGCLADMGSVLLHENRAFFWVAAEHPVPGVRALAAALGEDPTWPGSMVTTQAALNLPKRTTRVSAADIGALMACETEADAAPYVEKLLDAYESAKPVRQKMLAAALTQTGVATRTDDGRVQRPKTRPAVHASYGTKPRSDGQEWGPYPDFFSVAVLDEQFSEYAGYTGPVAQNISRQSGKPAVIFVPKGVDEHGQKLYKFSSRNDCGASFPLGGLISDPLMRQACTLKKRDEAGEVIEEPVVGGHAPKTPDGKLLPDGVVSGTCTEENLPKVVWAMQAYAQRCWKDNPSFWPTPWDGAEAYPIERKVSPARLADIEAQAKRLGPFTRQKQQLYPSSAPAHKARRAQKHTELQISVQGTLRDLAELPDDPKWLAGILDLGDGVTREVRYPADAEERPEGKRCEWLLRSVGKPGAYYLRVFHDPNPPENALANHAELAPALG